MDAVARALASGDDLYALLGVEPDASDEAIRHAYRALARRLHPDVDPGTEQPDRFRRIAAAYEVLGDEAGPRRLRSRAPTRAPRRGAGGPAGAGGGARRTAPHGHDRLEGPGRVVEPSRPRAPGRTRGPRATPPVGR